MSARRLSDPSARLALLRDALKKVGRKRQLLNADEMAAVAGMTWRNLKPQVEADPNWPVARRGSEGVAWQFDAGKVLKHMIAGLEAKLRDREAHSDRVAQMTGVAPEAARSLSVADLLKIDTLQTSTQRRKIEQRELIKRSEHEEHVGKLLTIFQSRTLGMVSRLDPAGRWPAAIRAEVADALRSLLVEVHDEADVEFSPPDARPASRTGRRARAVRAA